MVDADLVASKLGELADRISRIRDHRPKGPEALETDRDALDLVSFNLMLAVQACLDVASHIIADEQWLPANTLAASFSRLSENRVISAETAAALGRAAGLRNIVAHGYAGADPALVFEAATHGLTDLEAFANEVGSWLKNQGK